jgi:cytochrome c-type biogenesis protein CcmH
MPNPTPDQMQAMQGLTPAERQQAIRGMVEGLDARLRVAPPGKPEDRPQDRDAWLRLANARKVLGENDKAVEAYARADAIAALAAAQLADWAEAQVRLIQAGRRAVARGGGGAGAAGEGRAAQRAGAVLSRRRVLCPGRQTGGRAAVEDAAGAVAKRRPDPGDAGGKIREAE